MCFFLLLRAHTRFNVNITILRDAPLACGDILGCLKHVDDGVDACVGLGDGGWGGLHAYLPVNKIGLHCTVQGGFVGNRKGDRYSS